MPRALLSVSDKEGIVELGTALTDMGWDLVASGGTAKSLEEVGLIVTPVEQLTGLPEMLGGRVKTLHPAIHAGILARDKGSDLNEIAEHGYAPINMVVCNLYPFQETVSKVRVTLQDAIENIDIGGVTLLRAAAKNFFRVITICDPQDYNQVIAAIRGTGEVDLALRRDLAVKAFAYTRDYDTAIHAFLSQDASTPAPEDSAQLPEHIAFAVHSVKVLSYGENPHQSAAYYAMQSTETPLNAKKFGGKKLSYNNILDVNAAWRAVSSFTKPTVVIVKHLTPTGIASADSIIQAYPLALASDPISAFGSIIAVNRTVDADFVAALEALFVEVIVAPEFTQPAIEQLIKSRKNCRILQIPYPFDRNALDIRTVHGGLLIQRLDNGDPDGTVLKTVTERVPTPEEFEALQFAWKAAQHVKSNSIVLAKPNRTVGIGGGLPSRVDAVELAVKKAGEECQGAVMASDAFFPFPDGIEAAVKAGVTAVIQPGGSIRDKTIIEAANIAGIAMVFTGIRHFRH
ncbi:MAG: bifunctional phosphoribosylaminoimidazolecarboxamide formyltransferase/IMP cyclohydrolase [Anaerolineae bacterium]|nr:bifunctional phosphoribosylaminoimidazolecarboxamide formyltransferase/IMP cyclohydrolase [Anaerolineae bacterium]